VREREHRFGSAAERGRDAGDDFDGKPCCANRLDLLAAAPENERVTALEPHDDTTRLHMRYDERIDAILRDRVAIALLGDRDALRRDGRVIQHTRIDETVVNDDVGAAKRLDRPNSEQAGVARTGSNKNNAPARRGVEEGCHEGAVGLLLGWLNPAIVAP
jgi:hypothetical protein